MPRKACMMLFVCRLNPLLFVCHFFQALVSLKTIWSLEPENLDRRNLTSGSSSVLQATALKVPGPLKNTTPKKTALQVKFASWSLCSSLKSSWFSGRDPVLKKSVQLLLKCCLSIYIVLLGDA